MGRPASGVLDRGIRNKTPKSDSPAAGSNLGSGLPQLAAKAVLVGVAYYVAARLGLRLALIQENVTPLWPPTGIAVVAFLVLGRRVWPGVALAAFLVNLPISTDAIAAGATAVGNTLAPLVAVTLLLKVGFRWQIDRLRDAIAIVFLGALFSMTISASIGTGTLVLSDAIPAHKFWPAWAVWWTGDAMGVLVVAPFLFSLGLFWKQAAWSLREAAEATGLLIVVAAVSIVVTSTDVRLLAVVVPFVGWAAWRFQQRGAAPAALLVVVIACWAAAHGTGPFVDSTLLEKMVSLQAFNATVAFSALLFAALVTERVRAREALERSAVELEGRVRQRTAELSAANQQLAEAQRVANIGSWEWDITSDRVTWSDELYRIYGLTPQEFNATYEAFLECVHPDDRQRVDESVRRSFSEVTPFVFEHRIVRPDGTERILQARGNVFVDESGKPVRMAGTGQDVTETKRAEREHRIAETLQRSLLPDRLPEIAGVLLAARYVPASADMEVGGDWYDVVPLPNGHVGLAIGDVAGHGLRAASTMGQLRMALRAYALEEESPAEVVGRVHQLAGRLLEPEMVTCIYLVFDPDAGTIRYSNAGHPPPLVIGADSASYLSEGLSPPIGAVSYPYRFEETTFELASGSTLLLFTDGLVERRGVSIHEGLERLKTEATGAGDDLEAMCDHLLRSMVGDDVSDDVALLALRPVFLAGEPLRMRVPAEPHVLAPLRQTLRRWLREIGAPAQDVNDILVACGEACANTIQHAYGAGEGMLEIEFAHNDRMVELTIRDEGNWRPPMGTEGGRGIALMNGLMESVDVQSGPEGTLVKMRKPLGARSG